MHNSNLVVKLDKVTLQFKRDTKPLFKELNLEVYKHDFVTIVGGNGAGKSALLKLVSRSYLPSKGKVYFNGTNLSRISSQNYAGKCVTFSQNTAECLFPSLSVFENYQLWQMGRTQSFFQAFAKNDKESFKEHIHQFNKKLVSKLDTEVRLLSGGEKQALILGLIFLSPPELLLLDEHTSALDPKTSSHIMELTCKQIAKYGITCMMVTHDLHHIKTYGNRLLVLKEGLVALDSREKPSLDQIMHYCYE